MEDVDNEKLTGEHLINGASVIRGNDHTSLLLKTHYLTQCMEVYNFKYKLPQNIFGANIRCSNCCTPWSVGKLKVQIQKKLSKSAAKKYKTIIKNNDKSQSEINKAIQNLHGKRYNIKCLVCTKTTIVLQNLKDCLNKIEKTKTKPANTEVKTKVAIKSHVKKSNTKHSKARDEKIANTYYQSIDNTKLMSSTLPQKIENSIKKRKRKDKFVGLCKAACEASQEILNRPSMPSKKNDMLNLFLKSAK